MQNAQTKKAQIVMSDLIVSMGIFLLLLIVAYSAWERQADQLAQWNEQTQAQQAIERGMMALTQSPGRPTNWALLGVTPQDEDIISVGLAQRPGVLDPMRVNMLAEFLDGTDLEYTSTQKKMGLAPYQVEVHVADTNGQTIVSAGKSPTSGTVSGTARSVAWYNQSMVQVRLTIWRNDTT